jgi:MFS family permease
MLIAMAVAVAALDAIRAAMLAAAVDQTDRSEGTTLGLAFVLMDGIGALGAVLAGLAAGFSWPHMFALAALLSIGSAVLAAAGRSPNRRCARGGFRL